MPNENKDKANQDANPKEKDLNVTGPKGTLADKHERPYDVSTMRQVMVVPMSEVVAVRLESGKIELLDKAAADERLAEVKEKNVYRETVTGNVVEGLETNKGIVLLETKGARMVEKNDQFDRLYTKVK